MILHALPVELQESYIQLYSAAKHYNGTSHRTELYSQMKLKKSFLTHKINNRSFITALFLLMFTFTFSHFADAFIQSDLQLGNT